MTKLTRKTNIFHQPHLHLFHRVRHGLRSRINKAKFFVCDVVTMVTCEQISGPNSLGFDRVFPFILQHCRVGKES